MHRYLRSIGFSKIENREELQELINEVVEKTILRPDKSDKENSKKEKNMHLRGTLQQMRIIICMPNCPLISCMELESVCAVSLTKRTVFSMNTIFHI